MAPEGAELAAQFVGAVDGERSAEHRARICAGKIIGEKPERDSGEAGADERDDLRHEQMPIGAIGENFQHDYLLGMLGRRKVPRQ